EVEALVEVALARSAFTEVHHGDLVLAAQLARIGDTDRVQYLSGDDARCGGDVQPGVAPVVGHLAATAARVQLAREEVEHDLAHRHADYEHYADVSVVGHDPVVAGLEGHGAAYLAGLVALSGHRERRASLTVECEHAVADLSRDQHLVVAIAELSEG